MFKILILFLLLLVGCKQDLSYNTPYIEDNRTSVVFKGHIDMCYEIPTSIFCEDSPSVGDTRPTMAYAVTIANRLDNNTRYEISDNWHYNYTVDEYLIGDCEDVAMTIIQHMVDEGIDKKHLHLVYRLVSTTEAHMFVAVDTIDRGLIHIDYAGSGGPIEEQINFHMRMDNVGVYRWIKGNIKQTGE